MFYLSLLLSLVLS